MEKTKKNELREKEISSPVLGIECFPRLLEGRDELLEELQKMMREHLNLQESMKYWSKLNKSDWYYIVGWTKSAINEMFERLSLGSALYFLSGYDKKMLFDTISYWYEMATWEEKANFERGFYAPKSYEPHGGRVHIRSKF